MHTLDRNPHADGGDELLPTPRQRLASLLVRLAQQSAPRSNVVEIRLSRQIIADYLGLTLDVVCRELMALERETIVAAPTPHLVKIQDLVGLQNISRAGN